MLRAYLNLVVIRATDIDRACRFYEIVGLTFTKHRHGSGPEHYACEQDGMVFEIYPCADDGQSTSSTRLGFIVPSVDATIRALQEQGATVAVSPKASPWGRRAVVNDPDGHRIELTQLQETNPGGNDA